MSNTLSIDAGSYHFRKNSKPWFYLADTCWSAFTNIALSQWEQYLDHRRAQGFNALQVTILPQWDRSQGYSHPEPFKSRGGRWDYGAPNLEYFQRAREMLARAQTRGFTPALVLLWCDCVGGSWAADRLPGHEIHPDEVEPWARYVAETFAEFDPLYLVSGDTDFKNPRTLETYLAALRAIKRHAPTSLTTLHLQPEADLPEQIVRARELDFYMFQSGHQEEHLSRSWLLAERFLGKSVRRPVINGEPCYEGHGFGFRYGRFSAWHVRQAIWQSLLSGAKAGVTYGAHGIWSWHEPGKTFPSAAFSAAPYPWYVALRFPGAWDAGYARRLFEGYALSDLQPLGAIGGQDEIRAAASPELAKIAVYFPYAAEQELPWDLSGYDCLLIDLADRRELEPVLAAGAKGHSLLRLPEVNADVLLLARRR